MSQTEAQIEAQTIINKALDDKSNFDITDNINNLYHICLQYFTLLKLKKHTHINLITEIMDLLIELKKDKDLSPISMKNKYDEIHSMAYKNIESIYNFDKEQDLENGIDIKPVNMDELVKIRMENASENNNENIERGLSLIENKEKDD